MLTIPEIDEIAKRATERIAKDFAESGFINPPIVTHGIARAVLEAAQQMRALDLLSEPACCASFVLDGTHHRDCRLAQTASQ